MKDIEIVEKTNIFNYNAEKEEYLKIILYDPKNVSFLRDLFEKGYSIGNFRFDPQTYESKINFPLRFMVDRNVVGMSWVKVEAGKFRLNKKPISNCQIEAWCNVEDIIPLSIHGEYSKLAPLRILSIDIECSSDISLFISKPNSCDNTAATYANAVICIAVGGSSPKSESKPSFACALYAHIIAIPIAREFLRHV